MLNSHIIHYLHRCISYFDSPAGSEVNIPKIYLQTLRCFLFFFCSSLLVCSCFFSFLLLSIQHVAVFPLFFLFFFLFLVVGLFLFLLFFVGIFLNFPSLASEVPYSAYYSFFPAVSSTQARNHDMIA